LLDVLLRWRRELRPARAGRFHDQSQFRKPARPRYPHPYRIAGTGRGVGHSRAYRRSARGDRSMSEAFTKLTAVALPLLFDNIDTDIIIPSREMKTVGKTGLADGLFAGWRYVAVGSREKSPGFLMNKAPY